MGKATTAGTKAGLPTGAKGYRGGARMACPAPLSGRTKPQGRCPNSWVGWHGAVAHPGPGCCHPPSWSSRAEQGLHHSGHEHPCEDPCLQAGVQAGPRYLAALGTTASAPLALPGTSASRHPHGSHYLRRELPAPASASPGLKLAESRFIYMLCRGFN